MKLRWTQNLDRMAKVQVGFVSGNGCRDTLAAGRYRAACAETQTTLELDVTMNFVLNRESSLGLPLNTQPTCIIISN
jgi:hypothetical protein